MKKILKKVLTAMCALILCVVCFTGCSWLEINKEKYYNQVVATIGDKEFNKKDLIEAFSNYGYQYYQQYGYSMEDSIKETIKSMIDRQLLLDVVKSDEGITAIVNGESQEIKRQVFDYMQDSINSFETKIRKEWDMEITYGSEEETEPLRTVETEYTPTTSYEAGVVTRIKKDKEKEIIDNLPLHFSKSTQIITDKKVSDEAWARYVKSLQDAARNEGRSDKEEDVVLYEENRLIELMTNNRYLELFEEKFLDRTPVNTSAVINYFKEQYKAQKETYSANESLYHTAMKDASRNFIYFNPNSGNEYVRVKHILMNFTQTQKDSITSLNTRYGVKDDNTEADELRKANPEYRTQLQAIINQTKTTFEMSDEMYNAYATGYGFTKVKDNTYSGYASDVYHFVQDYVDGINQKQKSAKFNELVYIFNDDGGFMNSEFDYVVNLDTEVTDQMVKPFANGVRALDKSNGGLGAGSMDMVATQYGLHIIFHNGNVENLIDENNIDNISDEKILDILCSTMTTPESNKSIFNFIYDTLKLDENMYNIMTQEIVKNERTKLKENNVKIVYYKNNYKDLWK